MKLTDQNVPLALEKIQTAHHDAYFGQSPKANLRLASFTGDDFNPTFVVAELRVGVMILRRALNDSDTGELPTYMTMETRQVLGKSQPLQGLRLREYCAEMTQAILEALRLFNDGCTRFSIATSPRVHDPRWQESTLQEARELIDTMLRTTQSGDGHNLTIRFSTKAGLSMSFHTPKEQAEQYRPKYQVFVPHRSRSGTAVVSLRINVE